MSPTPHERVAMLQAGRLVAAELAGEAIDPEAVLTMADRLALATLALAVDLEASRRAGVEPVAEAREVLAGALARLEGRAA
jgi:hypothetical protein